MLGAAFVRLARNLPECGDDIGSWHVPERVDLRGGDQNRLSDLDIRLTRNGRQQTRLNQFVDVRTRAAKLRRGLGNRHHILPVHTSIIANLRNGIDGFGDVDNSRYVVYTITAITRLLEGV